MEKKPASRVRTTSPVFARSDGAVTEDSLPPSYDCDSDPWGNTESISRTEIEDGVPGRWVTASLVEFVKRDLEEQKIDSLPLRGGFAREYYGRLVFAESNLSLLVSRAHVNMSNERLLDGRTVFYCIEETLLSNLWVLLICIKITCVTKARRWANLGLFAKAWKETENLFFNYGVTQEQPEKCQGARSNTHTGEVSGNGDSSSDDSLSPDGSQTLRTRTMSH